MRHLTPAICLFVPPPALAQPFDGKVFMSSSVLTAAGPSGLRSITCDGRDERRMFDRRVDDGARSRRTCSRPASPPAMSSSRSTPSSVAGRRGEPRWTSSRRCRAGCRRSCSRGVESAWVHAGHELFSAAVVGSGILIHTGAGAQGVRGACPEPSTGDRRASRPPRPSPFGQPVRNPTRPWRRPPHPP